MKSDLRKQMRAIMAAIPPEQREVRSRTACGQMASLPEFRRAGMVLLFLSMPTEIDTTPLLLRCWTEGKSVCVPRVDWDTQRMDLIEIRSLDTGLSDRGIPGLREPVAGTPVPLDMINFAVIPGMAFDRRGYRLGRGKGFYDRLLARPDFAGMRCGFGYDEQLLPEIAIEPHDMPMQMIVTDARIVRVALATGAHRH
jgi:5-formyltetrahydrofolate cyclo-ligase